MTMMRYQSLLLLLLALLHYTVQGGQDHTLRVQVYEGPSKDGGKCSSSDETITEGDYVKIHYTASIDLTSQAGEPGKQYYSTREDDGGVPVGVTLGHGEVIAGWDEGLVGLCQGDKVILIVPPHLAYGDKGTEEVPPDATLKFDVEIVSVMEGPSEEEDDEEAMQMFENADKNKDGKLSRQEFDAMFAEQMGEDVTDPEEKKAIEEQLSKFWDGQDFDEDGFLSLEEFMAPSTFDTDHLYDDEEEEDPREEFDSLDTNKDGKLSKEEVDEFFKSVEQEVPEDFWEHLDEDKDGFISFEEFWVLADDEEYDEYDGADEL